MTSIRERFFASKSDNYNVAFKLVSPYGDTPVEAYAFFASLLFSIDINDINLIKLALSKSPLFTKNKEIGGMHFLLNNLFDHIDDNKYRYNEMIWAFKWKEICNKIVNKYSTCGSDLNIYQFSEISQFLNYNDEDLFKLIDILKNDIDSTFYAKCPFSNARAKSIDYDNLIKLLTMIVTHRAK